MHHNLITFQLATHYLPKIALRLESLLTTIQKAHLEQHPDIHNCALQYVLEILKLIQKPELKSRFLKELMRIEHGVNKVDMTLPPELYTRLYAQIQVLTHVVGRFGDGIGQNPFLQSLSLAQILQFNDCDMHSPQLILWLESSPQIRQNDLLLWLNSLRALHDTVNIYLALLRHSAHFNPVDMINGFYQSQLPPRSLCHLILLRMDKTHGIIPQMQIGHHGLSLRLFEATSMKEVRETPTQLELAICQL